MSREIKFRFWLGHSKKMTYPHDLKEVAKIIKEFTPDIVSIQYTGLKDKNGKEIYEGDIVKRLARKFDFDGPEDKEVYYENETSIIEYSNHGFWVKDESFGWEGESLWDWESIEIIGNIYENPEMIPYDTNRDN